MAFGSVGAPGLLESRDFQTLQHLLDVTASPAKTKERLQELLATSAETRALLDELHKQRHELQRERDAHERKLKAETAAHESRLSAERQAFEAECARRTKELDDRSAQLAVKLNQVERDAQAAKIARENFELRFARLQELARS
jgi:hypothetical protein